MPEGSLAARLAAGSTASKEKQRSRSCSLRLRCLDDAPSGGGEVLACAKPLRIELPSTERNLLGRSGFDGVEPCPVGQGAPEQQLDAHLIRYPSAIGLH